MIVLFPVVAENEAEKKLFGFSFLPLESANGITVQDKQHELCFYKVTLVCSNGTA